MGKQRGLSELLAQDLNAFRVLGQISLQRADFPPRAGPFFAPRWTVFRPALDRFRPALDRFRLS
jgi:hypothetical protein